MKLKILCHQEILEQLKKQVAFPCTAFERYDEKAIVPLIGDCDVLISWLASQKIIEGARNLKLIQCWGIGIDEIDVQFASKRGVMVANMAGYNSSTVAEYCMGAVIVLSRQLGMQQKAKSNRLLREKNKFASTQQAVKGRELAGKTLAIIGYGSIGHELAFRAKAFGMKVLAIKRAPSTRTDQNAEFIGSIKDLHAVLEKSDFVSINLPMAPETRGFFGEKEIAAMKPKAFLIDASRGGIVDDKALLEPLKKRSIAGAALDVYDYSLENDLAKLKNVVLTPHIAGHSEESTLRAIKIAAENINRLSNGQPLLNVVSPGKL